jgi:ATP-dependent helicase Lhr and Lhr-like helicase
MRMSSFDLLSPNMQKKIWEMRWEEFTPIQDKAIPAIIETDDDIIISSGTASGKTEAAFLPILTLIEDTAKQSLKVLYVSPLKALINNQFERIESLCKDIGIPIHKWHGDVLQSKKKKFIQNPAGILQITPESIESLFINRTSLIPHIFNKLDFIVIDEIHSFLDVERGIQLRSLLARIEKVINKRPRYIGLSATIDNFEFVKQWVNFRNTDRVRIIHEKGYDKELLYHLMHFQRIEANKKPIELYEDIRELTREAKAIIFCNSREEVEFSTVLLNRLAQKEGVGKTYYPHHSSIDKKEREFVEKTIAESTSPKSVIATSSLELGIDIGSIDIVIQVDSTYTVSSLRQRLGRSGRKQGSSSMLQLYSTMEDSLVQSLAVMELVLEKWVEPSKGYKQPFDILFHQIISMCQQYNGIKRSQLIKEIKSNEAFYDLDIEDINELLNYMIEKEILEQLPVVQELIIGIEGERILRSKEFYSVFMTREQYDVFSGTKQIGTIDKSPFINIKDRIILAGKLWEIYDIDSKRNKIYVSKASQGDPPKYSGDGGKIHQRIGEKMMEIICSDNFFEYIDEKAADCLKELRIPYHYYEVTPQQRVIWRKKDELVFETYTGTTIYQTLMWMLRTKGVDVKTVDGLGRIKITMPPEEDILKVLNDIKNSNWCPEDVMKGVLEREKFVSKYSFYLPERLMDKMHIANEIDIENTLSYLKSYTFRLIDL